MKRYIVTEKQIRKLKDLLEEYEAAPESINDEQKEWALAEGMDEVDWQDRDMKDAIEAGLCEVNREFKFLIEDIEAQELTFRPIIEKLAQELAKKAYSEVRTKAIPELNEKDLSMPAHAFRLCNYYRTIATATTFFPHLQYINCFELWNKAVRAEEEEPGAAYDVFMKALEDKDA